MQKIGKKIKVGLLTFSLLSGVSSAALLHHFADKNAQKFRLEFVVNQDTVSMLNFYKNSQCIDGRWYYVDGKGNKLSIDSLCDHTKKDSVLHNHYQKIDLQEKIDTVYVSYSDKNFRIKNKTKFMYSLGSQDSLPNQPSLGLYSYNTLVVREFVAQDEKLQQVIDVYNNEFNCTYRHEYQHYLNNQAGMRNWNSYSIKYVESCLDEVSASIAQCLEQRNNYLRHGNDIKYITKRFNFYRKAVENGKILPTENKLSEKEMEFIANGVFDAWMKEKYDIYVKRNNARTKMYLKDAPYEATKDNKKAHIELMRKIFTIDSYDFWKYIAQREQEISDKITDKQKKEYVALCQRKYKNMTHLEAMENVKNTKGEEFFQDSVRKNWLYAKIISFTHYGK